MRRKNVAVTLTLVLVFSLLHSFGVPLKESHLKEQIKQGQPQQVTGQVVRLERRAAGGYRFEVEAYTIDGAPVFGRETILVNYPVEMDRPWELFNAAVTFQGELRLPQERRNPGCFDYRLHLKTRGIFYTASVKEIRQEPHTFTLMEKAERFLIEKRYRFEETLSETSRGLVCGILFGDTTALEEDTYQAFQDNGTAHILAVSGLHIGILYGIYQKLWGKRQTRAGMVFLGVLLFSYGTISLWSPSVSRAMMMIALRLAAQALDLRYDRLTGLSTAALILMIQNPYILFNCGFQMSFLAMASIAVLEPVLPAKIPEGLRVVLVVNIGLTVYQMYQFNYISLVSLAANLPIVYLAGILVPVAFGSFVLFVTLGDGSILSLMMDSLSYVLIKVNQISTLQGYGSIEVTSPPLWFVLLFYLLLFFLTSEQCLIMKLRDEKKRLRICFLACMAIAALTGSLWYCPVSDDHVVFVDVGQGDCVHIRDGDKNVLIDGGGSYGYNVGENILKPYLLKNGVEQLDLAIATHLHTDHYQGLKELKEVYQVKEIRTGLIFGDQVRISERVWIETMWPLFIDEEKGQDENHQCSVFMIHYDGWRILVTGDLDQQGELEMLEFYKKQGRLDDLKADVLKVGHHGSKTSTCDDFLEVVDPDVAVIQVGVYNIYGHPDAKIVEKFCKKDIIVRRNDENGAVGFCFEKSGDGTKKNYRIHWVIEDV